MFFLAALSQQAHALKVKGYYLDNQLDTNFVSFEIPIVPPNKVDVLRLHDGLTFFDSNDNERALKPHQAKAFFFTYDDVDYHFVACQDYLNLSKKLVKSASTYLFLRLEVEGSMRLFSYTYTQHVGIDFSYPTTMMVYKRKNDLFFVPKPMSYKKSLIDYFEDCKEIQDKIKYNFFETDDDIEIVKLYNLVCAERA
jgi:hypothetical protein